MKGGIKVEIPGFGRLDVAALVSDFSGTLSCGGRVTRGVERRIVKLARILDIHILTADTFRTVKRELGNLPVEIHVLDSDRQDLRKERFVKAMAPQHVAALGNGMNDRLFLRAVRVAGGLAVAVDNGEGCATKTLQNAGLFIGGAENALDLLLEPDRLKATLRF